MCYKCGNLYHIDSSYELGYSGQPSVEHLLPRPSVADQMKETLRSKMESANRLGDLANALREVKVEVDFPNWNDDKCVGLLVRYGAGSDEFQVADSGSYIGLYSTGPYSRSVVSNLCLALLPVDEDCVRNMFVYILKAIGHKWVKR